VTIEVDYATGVRADFGAIVPGADRTADRTVRFVGDDPVAAYRGFLAMNRLASAVGR
jgi:D-aminopeptidase